MEKQEEAFTKFLNHQLVAANDTIQAFSGMLFFYPFFFFFL